MSTPADLDVPAGLDVEWPGGELRLSRRVHVMGILNVTPDSFSDGGKWRETEAAFRRGLEMIDEGADVIDVGGESTRPGSDYVEADEEIRRVVPVIEVSAERGVPVILMHMKGTPRNMQKDPHYDDLLGEVRSFFEDALARATAAGIPRGRTILDPGIGFGKRLEDNLALLNRLDEFASLGRPVLVGASRKSFIGMTLDLPVEERLEGTLAATALAVARGARIIRVHDVKANVRVVRMTEAMLAA